MNIPKEYLPVRKDPKFVAWHDEKDLQMTRSAVLNRGSIVPNAHSILWDRQNLQAELIARVGMNTDDLKQLADIDSRIRRLSRRGDIGAGMFNDGGEWRLARLPYLRSRLEDTDDQFREICRRAKLQGLPRPEMPKYLFDEKLRWQARIWVVTYEVEEITKAIAKLAALEKVKEEENILAYGIGSGTTKLDEDGCLVELHGQKIIYVAGEDGDDMPVIGNGPLMGLSVADYRELCAQEKARREKERREKLRILQDKCRAEGKPSPTGLPVEAAKKFTQKIMFPKGRKNWLSAISEVSV